MKRFLRANGFSGGIHDHYVIKARRPGEVTPSLAGTVSPIGLQGQPNRNVRTDPRGRRVSARGSR
jgi:hypothetical protein